jgi:DNA-directed RNA polymerase sigma subunit (sigma70/sigma32)
MGDDESGETYADRYLASENVATAADQRDLKRGIASALAKLNQKQAAAVKMFYGIDAEYPKCMDQIAEELNVSGERARQLVRAGEKALKQVSGIALLEEYL